MKQKLIALMTTVALAIGILAACADSSVSYYEVRFDLGGIAQVVDAPDAQTVVGNGYAEPPAATPDAYAAGKVFVRWAKTADGEEFVFAEQPITADTVVYAVWRDIYHYELTFDANGTESTEMPDKQTLAEREKPSYPAATPKNETKLFAGWYADSACTRKFDFNEVLNEDTTVYAKWTDMTGLETYVEYNAFRGQNGLTDAKSPTDAAKLEPKWEIQLASGWSSMGWPI